MRILACALSTVLLSGCSWLGGSFGGNGHHGASQSQHGYSGGRYDARAMHNQRAQDPCQVQSPSQPIPHGCDPASVTIGTGGFPQQPNFGGGYGQAPQHGAQYAGAGYGSHAGDAHAHAQQRGQRAPRLRKPKFRGTLSMGVEKSNAGLLLDYTKAPFDPVGTYNPQDYNEGTTTGTPAGGTVTTTTYTANARDAASIFTDFGYEETSRPDISFDDAWSTPARFAVGGEYIMNNKTTLFGNVGYSHAEGEHGNVANVTATRYRETASTDYTADVDTNGNATGTFTAGPTVRNVAFIPNQEIATFQYDFTDMSRLDLEVGARRYFNPIANMGAHKTLTPFVGAAVGASRYNDVSYEVTQRQAFYQRAFEGLPGDATYEITGPGTRVDLYDAQWVASGQLNAGVDWQVTPKTSLAFETGLRIEGARSYSNGEKGDTNIAVPFTLRGSYNF